MPGTAGLRSGTQQRHVLLMGMQSLVGKNWKGRRRADQGDHVHIHSSPRFLGSCFTKRGSGPTFTLIPLNTVINLCDCAVPESAGDAAPVEFKLNSVTAAFDAM